MKKIVSLSILFFCLASVAGAQTKTKNDLLLNSAGNSITIGSPVTVTNNTILFPGTLGLQGALLYISSVASSVGTTTWLNPGTNGFMLSLSGGVPTWSDPAVLLSGSYWSLAGNAPTAAYNGTTGSFLGTTNTQPLVLATANTTTAQPIEFFTNNVERARIISTGLVGLGTTTPGATLDITGRSNVALPISGTVSSSGTAFTGSGTSFTTILQVGDEIVAGNQRQLVASIASNTSLTTTAAFNPVIAAGSSFGVIPTSLRIHTSTSESITSLSNGNVGINNATPATTLQVTGRANVSAAGTISSSGSTVTGTSSLFSLQLNPGDVIVASGQSQIVTAVASNTSLTTQYAFNPVISAGASYVKQEMIAKIETNTNIAVLSVNPLGDIGIGTILPNTTLDINGDLSTRAHGVTLSNGVNNNASIGAYSSIVITGPTAPYSITGFTNGTDGKELQILNLTAFPLTLSHQSTSSSAGNRIFNPSNFDITIADSGMVTLTYNATFNTWVVRNSSGGMNGTNGTVWLRTKNDASITNSTTFQSAPDFDFYMEPNSTYLIHMVIIDSGVGGAYFTGYGLPITGSTSSGLAITGVGGSVVTDVDIIRNGISTNGSGTATLSGKAGYGIADYVVHTTTNGGLSQLYWGMLSSGPTKTLWLFKDSYMVIKRIE